MNLQDFKVCGIPDTAYYVPNFITEEQEQRLLDKIDQTPQVRWTQLSNRRLQNWGGIPHPKGMIAEDIPPWLQAVVDQINGLGIFDKTHPANHLLLNEYKSGEGIMPHLDGDLFYPTITTVSLKSHTVLNFYSPMKDDLAVATGFSERLVFRLLVEPRSLLVLKDELYHKYLHGIDKLEEDDMSSGLANMEGSEDASRRLRRGTRISLTVRNVPKTKKFKLKLGK